LFPFEFNREDRPWIGLFAFIALVQAIVVFALVLSELGGNFMFPLDDSYIHLQYARRLAEGAPLSYSASMAPSGGMTSPLFVALISPLYLLGFHGTKAAMGSFLFGALLWMLAPIWTYQLAKRLGNTACGVVAGALVLSNGHLMWNFLSGMETGLFTLLIVGIILGCQVWWQSEKVYARVVTILFLALIPLARPEGMIFILILGGIVLWRRGEHPRLSLVAIGATVLPFFAWLGVLWAGTGNWRPAGLIVKGFSGNPYFSLTDKISIASDTLWSMAGKFYWNQIPDPYYADFKGVESLPYVATGMVLLSLFAAGWLLVSEFRSGKLGGGSFLALAWFGGVASLSASLMPFIHQQRYPAPYTVLAIVLAVLGLYRLSQLFQQREHIAFQGSALALIVLSLPSLGFWATEYARNSRDIHGLLRKTSYGFENTVDPIAITDAGVLTYYGTMPVWDLIGLTSSEFTTSTPHGEGATLEVLGKISPAMRPMHLVSYRSWFSQDFPIDHPEWQTYIPRTTITSGLTIGKFPIEWDKIDLGNSAPIVPGMEVLLDLDIADLVSEEKVGYKVERDIYDYNAKAWPQPLAPVTEFTRLATTTTEPGTTRTLTLVPEGRAVDGGRVVRGESFKFEPVEFPDDKLVFYARLARVNPERGFLNPAHKLTMTLKSIRTGEPIQWDVELPEGEPETIGFDLSGAFDVIGGIDWKITMSSYPENGAWESYHYWLVRDPRVNIPPDATIVIQPTGK
jgi:hypothetical protein